MALTPEQKSSRLFKKSMGAGETILARDFFEEPKLGNNNIITSQIWSQSDAIPNTAPILGNGVIDNVVQYIELLSTVHIPGSTNRAYYHDDLKDVIPFNFGDGTYNYGIFKSDGITQIAFGEGDWLLDTSAGVLTFYGTVPAGVNDTNPPKVSFYKYVGDKGLVSSGATSGLNVKDPVSLTTVEALAGTSYDDTLSGFTSLPTDVDGVSGFTEGQRILVKDQVDAMENGIYDVSGTTLVRAIDHDGMPIGEVGVNDYVFVTAGDTLIATSWVLSATDATDQDRIHVGIDTQIWSLFAQSRAYVADGLGLKLVSDTFGIDLNDGVTPGSSGLEQTVDGLSMKQDILSAITGATSAIESLEVSISGNTSDITDLSTALSTEISETNVDVESLSTAIVGLTGDTASLSTAVSTNESDITDLSTSLSTTDSNLTSLETTVTGNTSDITDLSTALSTEISSTNSDVTSLSNALTGSTEDITSLSTALSTEISNTNVDVESLSTAIVGLTGDTSSLSTALSTVESNLTSLETTVTGNTSDITDLSSALSAEISTTNSEVISLSTAITLVDGVGADNAGSGITFIAGINNTLNVDIDGTTLEFDGNTIQVSDSLITVIDTLTGDTASLETALSTEISTTDSEITSLSTAISTISGDTLDITSVLADGEVLGLEGGELTGFTYTTDITSLSTAISGETDARVDADISLSTAIADIQPLESGNAGSGLTYIPSGSTPATLNVNVDDYTIKIVNNELRTPETWIESDYATTIADGTTGVTGIVLDYDPVGYVSAFINGVEYMVSPLSASSDTNMPFFFDTVIPTVGSVLNFDASEAGFGLISGTDVIVAKYHFINIL